jgi:hypothetical protein
MKKLLVLLLLFVGLLAASPAAANCNSVGGACFWIGGTGTWDNATDSAHWSNTSGSTTCSCEPTSTSVLTFDASSGGGTVTPSGNITMGGLVMGAFTGNIAWNTNNPNVTISSNQGTLVSNTGTGTRTINLGSGTWTVNTTAGAAIVWNWGTLTNCTCSVGSATINFTASGGTASSTVSLGTPSGGAYGTIGLGANAPGWLISGSPSMATLNIIGPASVGLAATGTVTLSNNFTWAASGGSNWILLTAGGVGSTATVTSNAGSGTSTCTYCVIRGTTFSGTGVTFTGTNSVNQGANTGMTFSPPTTGGGGGGGGIIGG